MLYLGRYSDSTYDVQDTPKLTVPIASAVGKTRDDTSDLIARHADQHRREYRAVSLSSPHFWMGNISTVTRSAHWAISGQFDCYYRMEKYILIGHEVSDRQLKDQIRDGLRDIYRH
jgi:hypothetical protein